CRSRSPTLSAGHGAIRKKGLPEGSKGHARTEARHAQVGPLRQEGHEPEAGDRDRSLAGPARRWQGPGEKAPALRQSPEEEVDGSSRALRRRGPVAVFFVDDSLRRMLARKLADATPYTASCAASEERTWKRSGRLSFSSSAVPSRWVSRPACAPIQSR